MPARVPPESVARIRELAAQGKSSRVIAAETGIGKSSVARYMTAPAPSDPPLDTARGATTISHAITETVDMLNDNAARSFLNEIGVSAPAASLRNDVLPVSSPLKNNPKALLLAQSLLGANKPTRERLTVKASLPPAVMQPTGPPPPPSPPVEPPLDSAQMITRIQMNVENFGPLLKHIVKPDTDTFLKELFYKGEDELRLLLRVIERARITGNMANQFKHVFWMTTGALEAGAPFIGVKAQGLTAALRQQDEEIALILKEMALERADAFQHAQRPEMRLAFLVSTTLLSVDSINRIKAQRSKPLVAHATKPVAEENASDAKEKYNDL
jgi:hypothetical protein